MLNTLPNQYSYIGDLIDTLKEEDQTASYVKNKIQIAEMKNNSEYSEQRSNVFAAKKNQKGSCFKCGRTGHFARECQNGGQAGQSGTTWQGSTLRPWQGRKRQLRQRVRKLPSASSQHERAEWQRCERIRRRVTIIKVG